jgi:hypothetical protein
LIKTPIANLLPEAGDNFKSVFTSAIHYHKEYGMNITRTSPLSGATNTVFINGLTQDMLDRWTGGELIQDALASIPQELREFVMTGITPGEWDRMLPPEDEEE